MRSAGALAKKNLTLLCWKSIHGFLVDFSLTKVMGTKYTYYLTKVINTKSWENEMENPQNVPIELIFANICMPKVW